MYAEVGLILSVFKGHSFSELMDMPDLHRLWWWKWAMDEAERQRQSSEEARNKVSSAKGGSGG